MNLTLSEVLNSHLDKYGHLNFEQHDPPQEKSVCQAAKALNYWHEKGNVLDAVLIQNDPNTQENHVRIQGLPGSKTSYLMGCFTCYADALEQVGIFMDIGEIKKIKQCLQTSSS